MLFRSRNNFFHFLPTLLNNYEFSNESITPIFQEINMSKVNNKNRKTVINIIKKKYSKLYECMIITTDPKELNKAIDYLQKKYQEKDNYNKYNKEGTCLICYESNKRYVYISPCNHVFSICGDCNKHILSNGSFCPMCNDKSKKYTIVDCNVFV